MKNLAAPRLRVRLALGCVALFSWMGHEAILRAATTGAISGTLMDPSGSVIPGAMVLATNTAQGIQNKTVTDSKGFYSFPSLPVGTYDLKAELEGFKPRSRKGLVVDLDSALQIDLTLEMADKMEEITVLENAVQVVSVRARTHLV